MDRKVSLADRPVGSFEPNVGWACRRRQHWACWGGCGRTRPHWPCLCWCHLRASSPHAEVSRSGPARPPDELGTSSATLEQNEDQSATPLALPAGPARSRLPL